MSTQDLTDLKKEKAIITKLVHEVLVSLHGHFPWTVIEIAISFNERIGEDNPFVLATLDGVLDEETKKKLDEYLPECTEDGALSSDMALQLMNSFSSHDFAKLSSVLNKPLFSLDTAQKEECLPWDLSEQPLNYDGIGNERTMLIINIKMKLRELAMLRGIIARRENECGTECIAIDTILEILNFDII